MPKLDDRITALQQKLKALKEKQQIKERAERQVERQKARKAENAKKYALGGLFKIAEIFERDAGALLGALLSLRPMLSDPLKFDEFKRTGDALLARRERERKDVTTVADAAAVTEEYLK